MADSLLAFIIEERSINCFRVYDAILGHVICLALFVACTVVLGGWRLGDTFLDPCEHLSQLHR